MRKMMMLPHKTHSQQCLISMREKVNDERRADSLPPPTPASSETTIEAEEEEPLIRIVQLHELMEPEELDNEQDNDELSNEDTENG